jgi:PAS domain S-box-containing protein
MVWVVDQELSPTGTSDAWEAYTGQTFEEYSGLGWMDAIYLDDRVRLRQAAQAAATSGTRMSIELRIRRADGQWRRHLVHAIPVRDAGVIVEWIGTAIDVEAERRTADEQRDLRSRLLALTDGAEALLSTRTVEAARASTIDLAEAVLPGDAHAIWWLDISRSEWGIVEARRLSASFADARIAGPPVPFADPLAVADLDDMPLLEPRREAYAREGIRSLLAVPLPTGGARVGVLVVYYRTPHEATDTERRVGTALGQVAAAALWNAETYEALHTSRTLAEHHAARMAALAEEAEKANHAKDNFLAILSHELRTPLNAIMGWSHMLRDGLPDDMVRHAIEVIGRNARAQKQLIEELLDVARIASGRLDLHLTTVNLVEIGRMAVDSALPAARAREITLSFESPGEPVLVEGDADRLQQVASNLLSNALKFTEGGGRVTLRVEKGARLAVSDTGAGIATDFLPHVFDRFSQFDSSHSRPFPGLGLGLWVVKEIVGAHGGTAAAHSEGPGRGTTIEVTLPRPGR